MAASSIDLSAGVIPDQEAAPQGGIDLSAGVVDGNAPKAPVNPYAIDMSKVAGAVPGMPSPGQVAAQGETHAAPQMTELTPEQAALHIKPDADTGRAMREVFNPTSQQVQRENAAGAGIYDLVHGPESKEESVAQAQQNLHPSAERVMQSVDPVLGSWATGTYEAGAGAKDLAKGAIDRSSKEALQGATRTIGGAMTAGMPEFGLAAWQAPIKTMAYYYLGVKSGEAAQDVAKKLGMSPEAQQFANTVGTFIPVAFHTVTQLRSGVGTTTARVPDAATGGVKEVPVKTAAVGGRGFGFGVGKGEDGSYYAAGRVGPFSAKAKWGGDPEGAPQGQGAPAELPAPAPDPVAAIASQQAQTVKDAAVRAVTTEKAAQDMAAGVPPPKPPSIPKPAGMDDGALTQDVVTQLATSIRLLPSEQQAPAVLEATDNLAKWLLDKGTVVGPDGKVLTVDSPKSAKSAAVKIVNDEVERQTQAEVQAHQQAQQEAEQKGKDAETARQEQEATLEPQKPSKAAPAQVEVPDTPTTQRARQLLRSLPDDATSAKMDQHLRDTIMLPAQVRKAIVADEVSRRAQEKNTAAQEAMTGKPTPEGQKPEEIDRWVKGVKDGEEPFAHIQKETTYRPKDTEGISRTKVDGAGDASGIYYHDPELSAADIRKAARAGTLEQLREQWKKGNAEFGGTSEIHKAEADAEKREEEYSPAPVQQEATPFEGAEGKRTEIHLADGSSIPATHMLVERSSLHASHLYPSFEENPVYPPGVQERSYHKSKSEQMKVHEQIGDFKPEHIVNNSPVAESGAPIVTSDPVTIDGVTYPAGTVLGGNSRKLTLDGVYTNGAEGPYRSALEENHRTFGFPHESLEQFGQPVHVRAVKPPKTLEEMHRIGSLLNKSHTQSLDALDQAVSLGKHLSPDTLEGIAEAISAASDGDSAATLNSVLSDARTGRQIVKMLERDGIITDRNRPSFVDPSTMLLTTPAKTQLGNALLANLLDTRELMEKTPAFLKQRLLGAIGAISAITAHDDHWNLAPALREAAKQYGELHRQSGMKPTEALAQAGMFGDERGPVTEALIKAYDKNVGEIRKALGLFSIGAEEGRNPSGRLVGLSEEPHPALDFNFAFGTDLTPEQFDAEMGKLRNKAEAPLEGIEQTPAAAEQPKSEEPAQAPQGEILPPPEKPSEQPAVRPFAKGDQVTYTTNAGKQRAGEIAFTDGRIARIKDAKTGTVITKKIGDVQRADHYQGMQPSIEGEKPTVTEQLPAESSPEPATQQEEKPRSLVEFLKGEIADGGGPRNYNELKYLAKKFDGAEPDQLRMKQMQEAYEAAMVATASDIVNLPGRSARAKFDSLVERYENQPNLSIRTSTSIQNQAYSTPAPLAYIVDRFADVRSGDVYEPTAGNGMLLIGVPAKERANVWANEINGERSANLSELGFSVSHNDASKWAPEERFGSVVANPPFAALPGPVDFDGYKITKLDHLIALKSLETMKDDGRAAIIIGASKEPGEVTAQAKPFFNYLYSHYNVVTDFELDGDLYSRQGASWPVRVLAIEGRARSNNFCPPASSIERLSTWREVYDKAAQHLGANLEGQRGSDVQPDGGVRDGAADRGNVSLFPVSGDSSAHLGGPEAGAAGSGNGVSGFIPGPIRHTGGVPTYGVGDPNNVVASDGDVAQSDRLAEDEPRREIVTRRTPRSDSNSGTDAITEGENQYQATYTPNSEKKDADVLAPRGLIEPMRRAMESLEERVGDLDEYVATELGYTDVETMQDAFMGLQVDTIAAGIDAVQRNRAIIIADQTGVGKGRQAAAIIRWAELHGKLPIFITAKAQLFTDMYGDLTDIGAGDTINPLLMNADAEITHPVTGQKVFGNPGKKMTPTLQRILETGKLPEDKNALFLTYSQINKANRQQLVLSRLAPNAVFVLDESHNAGGESNTGLFMRGVLDRSQNGVAFLSATWAKRPDNLPLYASKTDMGLAITDKDKIASAIQAGGAPLQAVLSHQLTQAGQHFRRERSFKGIDFPMTVMSAKKAQHEAMSDKVTECLRAIVDADHLYHLHLIDFADIQAEHEGMGETAMEGGNQASKTVNHMEFSSIVHNIVRQFLLGMKVDEVADKAIADIREGKKPIIALENTMGSFLEYYAEANGLLPGAPLHNFTYSTVLKRALDRTLYYNVTDEKGLKKRVEVQRNQLSDGVRQAYDAADALIRNLKVDVPVSPIDWIRHRIESAGFLVAEITGRTLRVDYSREVPILSKVPNMEKRDRVATAIGFNNGQIHALIMNTAGSTGISLHASVKFRDQSTRKMYVAQPFADINQFMQALGRNNRTGQVRLPEYELPILDLPTELRPAMVLSKKMKSLNANTTSNTRSSVSIDSPDMMNKYGDKVVEQYLADTPELAAQLHMHVNEGDDDDSSANEDVARKAIARSALLPVAVQKEFMAAITERYKDLIDYLDQTGQNDLEPKTYDFDAREMTRNLLYRGTEPSSPFGQDAYLVEYSIKHQGKPYTPEEVKGQIRETLGNRTDVEFHRDMVAELDKQYKTFLDRQTSDSARDRAAQTRQGTINFMQTYRVGSGVRVEINGESYAGVITSIEGAKKPSGNPFAASSMKYTVALNGAVRSIRVSGSELQKIAIMPLGQRINVDGLFKDFNPDARQKARVIVGNLLGAYGSLKNVKGRIISFTTAEGKNEIGILMPAKFDPAQHVSQEYAMRTAEGAQKFLKEHTGKGQNGVVLQAPGGDVMLQRKPGDTNLTIKTKTAKAVGGRFFNDPELRNLVHGGEFALQGGMMQARVMIGKEIEALRAIMAKTALYPTQSLAEQARAADDAVKSGNSLPEPPKPTGGKRRQDPTATLSAFGAGYADQAMRDAAAFTAKAVPATWNELVRFTQQSGKSAKKIGREIAAAVVPTYLASDQAKDIAFSAIGEPALRMFEAAQLLRGVDKMFQGMPVDKWVEYVHRYQQGRPLPSTDLRNAFDLMGEILHQQHLREEEAANLGRDEDDKINLTWKENYFPNRWARVPNGETQLSESEQIARILGSRRPLEGSKSFLKKQTQTMKEGYDKGFLPLGNPVKILLRRMQEGAKFVAANYMLHNGREMGLVRFLRKGKRMPEGFRKVPDKLFKVWRPVELEDGGRAFLQSGDWIVEDNFGRLIENHLSEDLIRSSEIGQQLMNLKTLTTQFRLGFSPFHYLNMGVETISSALQIGLDKAWNEGVRNLDASAFPKAVSQSIKSAVCPFTVGSKMLEYARNPEAFLETEQGHKFAAAYPDLPRIFMLGFKGGLRWEMPDTYKQTWGDGFRQAISDGRMGAAMLKFAPWIAEGLVKPLFEWYIPRTKWAYFAMMYSQQEAQYAQALAAGTITEETIAREVAASIDNRFGEFKFDALFLNNTARTASQLIFTSPTWKYGTWRGLIDAMRESNPFGSKAFEDRLFDKIDEDAEDASWMRDKARQLPRLGMNSGWIVSKIFTMVVLGSIMSRLFSGKWPWQWAQAGASAFPKEWAAIMEALHPRTGWKDTHGNPVRVNYPSDLKDYERFVESPSEYISGSLWSTPVSAYRTAVNRDWKGDYVFNPSDSLAREFWQGLVYNFKNDVKPISASNFAQDFNGRAPMGEKVARASGILGGSPKSLDETPALQHALSEVHREPHTPEQEEAYRLAQQQPPTRYQVLRAARERNLTYLDKVVLHDLNYVQAKEIYDKYANEQEKKTLRPIIERKRTLEILRARRGGQSHSAPAQ